MVPWEYSSKQTSRAHEIQLLNFHILSLPGDRDHIQLGCVQITFNTGRCLEYCQQSIGVLIQLKTAPTKS